MYTSKKILVRGLAASLMLSAVPMVAAVKPTLSDKDKKETQQTSKWEKAKTAFGYACTGAQIATAVFVVSKLAQNKLGEKTPGLIKVIAGKGDQLARIILPKPSRQKSDVPAELQSLADALSITVYGTTNETAAETDPRSLVGIAQAILATRQASGRSPAAAAPQPYSLQDARRIAESTFKRAAAGDASGYGRRDLE